MKVSRVFHREAVWIEPWQTLRDAAKRMHTGEFSCLPVMSGDDLLGIITERDLVEAIASDPHPESSTVFSHMSEPVATATLDDDCADVAARMLALGCRHLPVMHEGRLVGIVSARDLLPLATGAAHA